jgi:hypothetical protein
MMILAAVSLIVLEVELAALIVAAVRVWRRTLVRMRDIEVRTERCPWCRVPESAGTPP